MGALSCVGDEVMTMVATRYRMEGEFTCIDMVTKSARQLFDMRDPSPYRERDLDDDAVEYLLSAAREVGRRAKLRVVICIEERDPVLTDDIVAAAVRAHLTYERDRQRRTVRELLLRGRRFLAVGASALVLMLSAAQLTTLLPKGPITSVLHEGLVITGWVAMWRPLELLLYDWWPHVEQRRVVDTILAGEIVVVHRG